VLDGVRTGHGRVRLAGRREVAHSVRVLRRMVGEQSSKPSGGISSATRSKLDSIATCESHGDPTAIGGGGAYRGKYQFDVGTWQSVGGKGDPAAASEAEQDQRAAALLERDGAGHWPVCG
jgi:transglycosylase-like protein